MRSLIQMQWKCCDRETDISNRFFFIVENNGIGLTCGCKFIKKLGE